MARTPQTPQPPRTTQSSARVAFLVGLLGMAGAGTILIGLSPENVNVFVHLVGALNIPAGNVAMILLGLAIWRDQRGMAWFSVLAGVVGLLGMLAGPFLVILTGQGGGLAERIALYPLIIWLIVFGVSLVADHVRSQVRRRAASGGDDLPRQRSGHVVVADEGARERARPMRHRTQVDRIPRQLMRRNLGVDHV